MGTEEIEEGKEIEFRLTEFTVSFLSFYQRGVMKLIRITVNDGDLRVAEFEAQELRLKSGTMYLVREVIGSSDTSTQDADQMEQYIDYDEIIDAPDIDYLLNISMYDDTIWCRPDQLAWVIDGLVDGHKRHLRTKEAEVQKQKAILDRLRESKTRLRQFKARLLQGGGDEA